MGKAAELLPGTLDMLILKAVSLKPLHGYGVLLRIRQISKDALEIPRGSLYPALYRLSITISSLANGVRARTTAGRSTTLNSRGASPPATNSRLESASDCDCRGHEYDIGGGGHV